MCSLREESHTLTGQRFRTERIGIAIQANRFARVCLEGMMKQCILPQGDPLRLLVDLLTGIDLALGRGAQICQQTKDIWRALARSSRDTPKGLSQSPWVSIIQGTIPNLRRPSSSQTWRVK
jgi:hypothetical protein